VPRRICIADIIVHSNLKQLVVVLEVFTALEMWYVEVLHTPRKRGNDNIKIFIKYTVCEFKCHNMWPLTGCYKHTKNPRFMKRGSFYNVLRSCSLLMNDCFMVSNCRKPIA